MLIRQTLAYLPAQLLGPLTQFAAAIVLTHFLGAAEYGLTMLVFASQELVFLVCLAWWTIYMMRYAATLPDEAARLRFQQTETGVLFFASLAQVAATIAVIVATEPDVSAKFYFGAILFTVTRSFVNFLSERARNQSAILAYTILQIGAPLGGLVLTIGVMFAVGPRPGYVLLVFAMMQAFTALVVTRRLGIGAQPARIDRTMLVSALRFGMPVVVASAFGWLAVNGIRFVIEAADGPQALGLLSVGWGLATRLAAVAAMVVTAAAYPLAVRAMAAGDVEGAKRQLSDNSALLLGVIAPATFGVIAINEPLVKLLIAADYHAVTIQILPWALLGAAIRNVRMHGWDQLYLLMEAPRPMLALEIAESLVTLAGAAIGVVMGDIPGAVIGTTIAAAVIAAGDALYLRRRYGFRFPLWRFARFLIAAGAMVAAIRALPMVGLATRPEWGSVLATILFGAMVYGLAALVLFPREARAAFVYLREKAGR